MVRRSSYNEAWARPTMARKFHYFPELKAGTRSLCGSHTFDDEPSSSER
jgi:hypothetical protein